MDAEGSLHSHQRRGGIGITSSLPASARTMNISELRREIFQLVDRELSRKKTLLALAVTCKSFTGPALDLLWRQLGLFSPLIKCLPPSLWKLDKLELQFQRAMTFDDWSIFCKYNHRVHSLHMKASSCGVSTEILIALGYPPFSLPLLPNLMSLTWDAPGGTFPYIRSFLTQTLTTLNIHATRSDFKFGPSLQSILSFIPTLCPSVSHFHFHDGMELGDTSIALQCWSHLISATTGNVSDAAILHLSKLPSLRVLNLGLHRTPITADTQQLLQGSGFCALQELGVICGSCLAPVDAFFETLSISPKKLSITYWVDSVAALPASISRIPDACAHNALEYLRIDVNEMGDDFASISATMFEPLCAFRNLRRFNFESIYCVQLDATTLVQMARAWPLLEVLIVHERVGQGADHNITPNALVLLLQHCPRLASVAIAMNWSTVDRCGISPEVPYQGFAHGALSRADFYTSTIRHPTRVAAFLSAIAPKLETIVAWDSDGDDEHPDYEKYLTRWKTVHHLVEAFSLVREQGRRMAPNSGEVVGDVSGSGEDSRGDSGSEYTSHPDQVSSDSENERRLEI